MARVSHSLVAALVAAHVAGPAFAQPSGESSAIAEQLFQQARELVKDGHYDEACPKLAESQRLDPKLGTLLNLAVCHEHQGRTATAWAEFTSGAAIARRESQKDREDFARKQAAALEKKLSRLILQVSATDAGLTVKLDGQTMSGATYGVPLPLDPGKHHIAATAPGKAPWTKQIDVPEQAGETLVAVPPLTPAVEEVPPPTPTVVVPAAPPPVPATVVAPPPASPPKPQPSNAPTVLMGVGFGVGGLGLLIGAIAGGVAISDSSTIRQTCNGDACPGQQGALNSANTMANVSNAFFVVAAVGAAIGITGVVLRPKSKDSGALTMTPVVGAGLGGVRFAY